MVVIGLSAGKTDVGMAYCNGFGCRHWWMLRAGRYEAKPKSSVAVVLGGGAQSRAWQNRNPIVQATAIQKKLLSFDQNRRYRLDTKWRRA